MCMCSEMAHGHACMKGLCMYVYVQRAGHACKKGLRCVGVCGWFLSAPPSVLTFHIHQMPLSLLRSVELPRAAALMRRRHSAILHIQRRILSGGHFCRATSHITPILHRRVCVCPCVSTCACPSPSLSLSLHRSSGLHDQVSGIHVNVNRTTAKRAQTHRARTHTYVVVTGARGTGSQQTTTAHFLLPISLSLSHGLFRTHNTTTTSSSISFGACCHAVRSGSKCSHHEVVVVVVLFCRRQRMMQMQS